MLCVHLLLAKWLEYHVVARYENHLDIFVLEVSLEGGPGPGPSGPGYCCIIGFKRGSICRNRKAASEKTVQNRVKMNW